MPKFRYAGYGPYEDNAIKRGVIRKDDDQERNFNCSVRKRRKLHRKTEIKDQEDDS